MTYDLVVRGGTVVTASDSTAADIGVRAGRVAAIGKELAPGTRRSRPPGSWCCPAGSTCTPISTPTSAAMRTADDFETGTVAAAVRRDHDHLRLRVASAGPIADAGDRGLEGKG